MKGVIFTTFLEMVENKWDYDLVDRVVEKANPPSGGSYTAVGTYDHSEAVSLVVALSEETSIPVGDLLKAFGEHLFGILINAHPQFEAGVEHPLDFLQGVERYIHVEVRKLYPDAELPRFDCERLSNDELLMLYSSVRHLEDLCEGLIRGCVKRFARDCTIERETLGDGREQFTICLTAIE